MAFQLVRGLFSRGSPPRSRIHGPIMENAVSGDQRDETIHDIRDVEKSAEVTNWSQLARAPQKEEIGRYSHSIDVNTVIRCTECHSIDGFMYISSVNGCYKVLNRNLTWTAAGLECRSLHKDAHLLVINDAVEQTAVAGMLESISGQSTFFVLLHCLLSEVN